MRSERRWARLTPESFPLVGTTEVTVLTSAVITHPSQQTHPEGRQAASCEGEDQGDLRPLWSAPSSLTKEASCMSWDSRKFHLPRLSALLGLRTEGLSQHPEASRGLTNFLELW